MTELKNLRQVRQHLKEVIEEKNKYQKLYNSYFWMVQRYKGLVEWYEKLSFILLAIIIVLIVVVILK